jgi:hypothetical protein
MHKANIFLTGLDGWWGYITSGLGAVVALFVIWPKVRDSIVGRLTRENLRLRTVVGDMTIEAEIKNVILLANKKQIESLTAEIDGLKLDFIELRRKQFEQIHDTKNPEGPDR